LSDYISDDNLTFGNNPHDASIRIRIECEAEELPYIRQFGVLESKNVRIG